LTLATRNNSFSRFCLVNEVQVMGTNGTIIADRSQVSLRNISFSQTEPAKRIISSRQSQLDVADSIVGYENLPIIETAGIDIEEGSLKLRNVKFKNLQYGIFGVSTPLPSLDMDLFDLLNFENVQNPITPLPPWVNL